MSRRKGILGRGNSLGKGQRYETTVLLKSKFIAFGDADEVEKDFPADSGESLRIFPHAWEMTRAVSISLCPRLRSLVLPPAWNLLDHPEPSL